MENKYNDQQAKIAKSRRTKLLRAYKALHKIYGCHAMVHLANAEKLSVQRVSWMLRQAKAEAK